MDFKQLLIIQCMYGLKVGLKVNKTCDVNEDRQFLLVVREFAQHRKYWINLLYCNTRALLFLDIFFLLWKLVLTNS